MQRFLLFLLAAALGACAAPPAPPASTGLLHDAAFTPPAQAFDDSQIFALSDAMRQYLRKDLAIDIRRDGALRGLVDALYRDGALRLEYDSAQTRTAAQAFAAHRGNCLSLVIMTSALAHALGLQVSYQVVDVDPSWSHSGSLLLQSDHVNLVVARPDIERRRGYDAAWSYTIDFLPSSDAQHLFSHEVPESTIVAMYLNNLAAEALARGDTNAAYWWARAAVARAPAFVGAYNTLGVVYLRHGDLPWARKVLEAVLGADPDNAHAMNNLAIVYERLGLAGDARGLRARLARADPEPPYRYFFEGRAAMVRGDYPAARDAFDREVQRAAYCSEFHFWLGLADLRLGDLDHARREITLALQTSTNPDEYALYAGKLEHLRARVLQ